MVGGVIAFALVRSRDNKTEQEQAELGQNNETTVSSGKPTTEYEFLRRRVQKEGLEKIRPVFAKILEDHLSEFKDAWEQSEYRMQAVSHTALQTMGWVECWALTESYAIYNGEPVPENFDTAIWKPMLVALKEARPEYLKALKKMEESREKQVMIFNTKTGKKEVDPKKSKLFERDLANIRAYSDQAFYFLELARLAKVANRPDLVKQVFDAYDADMTMKDDHGNKPRKKVTLKEFLAFDHKAIFKEMYGKRVETIRKSSPPQLPKNVITEAEKTAIRKLHSEVNRAIITQDRKKLIGFCWNPSKEAIVKLDKLLKNETVHSIDISKTKYQFVRTQPEGPVTVKSSNYSMESTGHRAGSKPKKVTAAWNVKVMFVNGTPKIIFPERKK